MELEFGEKERVECTYHGKKASKGMWFFPRFVIDATRCTVMEASQCLS